MRTLFLIFQAITAVSPDTAEHIEAAFLGTGGGHYIYVEPDGGLTVWQETNGKPGLQIVYADYVEPDTRILA